MLMNQRRVAINRTSYPRLMKKSLSRKVVFAFNARRKINWVSFTNNCVLVLVVILMNLYDLILRATNLSKQM